MKDRQRQAGVDEAIKRRMIAEGSHLYRQWLHRHDLWDGFKPFEVDVRELTIGLFSLWEAWPNFPAGSSKET